MPGIQNALTKNALFNIILSFLYSPWQVHFNTVFDVIFIATTKYKLYMIKLLIP